MNWHSVAEFTEMGGHALYVWGAYGMTAAALLWEGVMLAHRRRSAIEALRDHEAQAQAPSRDAPRQ